LARGESTYFIYLFLGEWRIDLMPQEDRQLPFFEKKLLPHVYISDLFFLSLVLLCQVSLLSGKLSHPTNIFGPSSDQKDDTGWEEA